MYNILTLDFETRSTLDLKEVGADIYAKHPTTEVMACGYAFDDEEVEVIPIGSIPPARINDHIIRGGDIFGHNVGFEWLIWNYCWRRKFPFLAPLKIEQCHCTMAQAYAMGLPGALEKAAPAAGITQEKDMKGQRTMLQLAQPREIHENKVVWWDPIEHKDKYDRMYSYCGNDVEVERQLHKRLLSLSQSEREMWLLDHKINQRGVQVDIGAAKKAQEIVIHEQKRLNEEIREVTNNAVATYSANAQLTAWIKLRGVKCDGVSKSDVTDLLEEKTLPKDVNLALQIRREANKSSTAKFQSLILRSDSQDRRMKSNLQYHGATTGRWAGRDFQLHNLPRPKLNEAEIEGVFDILKSSSHNLSTTKQKRDLIELLYERPLSALSDCIRGFLIPKPGFDFLSADYSNIEGRVLAWLAGEDWKITAFKEFDEKRGPDLYKLSAQKIFNCNLQSVDSAKRAVGKVAELALGYGGGKGAFIQMSRQYGVKVDKKKAEEIKVKWREAHRSVTKFWYELERISIQATRNPDKIFSTKQIRYKKSGSFLFCKLPSDRVISYPYPKVEEVQTPWGAKKEALTYMAIVNNQWVRTSTYGGSLAENVTQAVARDILAEAIKRLERKNYPVVFHVHDSITAEVPKNDNKKSLEEFKRIMCELPTWGKNLPVNVEGYRGQRFRK